MNTSGLRPIQAAVLLLGLIPLAVSAHSGHAETTGFFSGLSHPLSGADHLLAIVAVGLLAARMGGRAMLILPATFIAMMAAGGIFGFAGLPLPLVEQGLLFSVFALGVIISVARQPRLSVACALVALFALYHGFAHIVEAPASVGTYIGGVFLTTLALHLSGLVVGVRMVQLRQTGILRLLGGTIALGGVAIGFAA